MNAIKFGPSGTDDKFGELGFKTTDQAPEFVLKMGLDCFEIPFGRGFWLGESGIIKTAEEARNKGVELSIHAPYFINFANEDPEKIAGTFGYLEKAMNIALKMNVKRVVFHPGSPLKNGRDAANRIMMDNLKRFVDEILSKDEYKDLYVCPETMGKINQMGSLEEIRNVIKLSDRFVPCFDFGHINSRYQGILKSPDDFRRVIEIVAEGNDDYKIKNMHVHFNKIEYGQKGEIRHLTFADTLYGPEFEPFCEVMIQDDLTPYVVCESNGTQSIDALYMKTVYEQMKKK